jgi:hypothetical protein
MRWSASFSSANAGSGGPEVTCCYLVALLIAAIPQVQEQRLGEAICRLRLESNDVSLSSDLRLTITVEGPAPVEVEGPPELTTSPDWRVRAGRASVVPQPAGRERYEQSFQLEPFQTGDRVPLPLEPWHFRTKNEVRDWTLVWPAQEIRVHSSVPEPDLSFARSVTGIEPSPPVPKRRQIWPVVLFVLVVLLATVIACVIVLSRVRRRRTLSTSPWQRVMAQLQHLEQEEASHEKMPALSDLLRRFLEEQFSLPATRQTSAEFCAALQQKGIGVPLEPMSQIFQLCDEVKFAGLRPDRETCRLQLQLARQWLTETLQPALTESVREANPKK